MKKILPLILLLTTACATTSPVLAPQVGTPAGWSEPATADAAAVSADWWQRFGSAELQTLVDEALAGSPDLAIAVERVRQAEAQVRVAGASLFPQVDVAASSSARTTRDRSTNSSVRTEGAGTTLSASYELDLWGRNAAGVSSAEASLRAAGFDRETARLTLIAGVASAYFEVLSLRGRIANGRDNVAIAERVLQVVSARARNGIASPLDVARQEATLLSQRAALLPLEQQERQTLAALAVLVGRPPEGFDVKAAGITDLAVPSIDPGLPSTLLVRRPDLASAEAQLAAANADVAAARAAMLPTITLTGSAGLATAALTSVSTMGATAAASIGASLLQPIFDGGRLRGNVKVAESRERELVEAYRKAILSAFADVETALAAASRLARREALQVQV
jgi:NodT family efflux transporter outer membrane factor (OMF) lipoprotein